MKPTEAAALLTIAAAYDNRKPDADAAKAWAMALDGYRFDDCRDAIVTHYRASGEWLMPAKIIAEVKRIRSKRIDDHPPLTPPAAPDHLEPAEQVAWQIEWRREATRRVGDGELIDCDAAYGELRARDLRDLRALVAPATTTPADVRADDEEVTA